MTKYPRQSHSSGFRDGMRRGSIDATVIIISINDTAMSFGMIHTAVRKLGAKLIALDPLVGIGSMLPGFALSGRRDKHSCWIEESG
jgi:hypothetical protein